MVTAGVAMAVVAVETATAAVTGVVVEDTIATTIDVAAAETTATTTAAEEAGTGTTTAAGTTTTVTVVVRDPAAAAQDTVGAALAPGRGAPLVATVPTAPPPEVAVRRGTMSVVAAGTIAGTPIAAATEATTVADMINCHFENTIVFIM